MSTSNSRKPRPLRGVDSKSLRIASRFWRYVDRKADGCWEWTGTKTEDGYGQFRVNGQLVYASRFSWIATFGIIPDEIIVCHRCDNPPCCRPDHLFLGTYSENVRDRAAKERHIGPRAEPRILLERESRRLSESERRQICALKETGNYSERFLAKLYHVNRGTIRYCIQRAIDAAEAKRLASRSRQRTGAIGA